MEYTVISVDKSGENIKTLVDSLSEDAYESIMDSVGQLQTAMLSKDYIAITLENIRELKQCMNAIDLADRRSFQSINRYVYNILGVFYAWIEYWESNYKTTFAPVKKKYYDKYFEYRMMYNLRRYMTHCEMAVTQIECHFDKDEMFIYIEPEKLLQHPKQLQKVFIPELEDMVSKSQKIDLGSLISKFERLYTEMNQELLGNLIYRSNGSNVAYATSLAKVFVNYFNTTESTAIVELAADQYHTKKADDNTHWQDVLLYCKDGCFQAMFDEYLHLIRESVSFSDETTRDGKVQNIMLNDLRIHTASYEVDTFSSFRSRVNGERKRNLMRAHYAVGFVTDGDDAKKADRKNSIRGAFNSPLRPFVLASTSIGQEGLDFHNYCRKIMHWNLPSNPIDLEQREGRINRFKCLAIRQNVARKYGSIDFKSDIWTEMFAAAQAEKKPGQSDLVPFWCFGEGQEVKIERIVPMYPMSKDGISYERLIKILSLYRLTLGQARQEELLEYLFRECDDPAELKKLFIDLSPYSKGK